MIKIDTDSMPRVRNGTQLFNFGNIIVHTMNERQLSCEAIKDNSGKSLLYSFDSINWFDENNQNLFFPFTIIELTDKIHNFSTLFDHSSPKVIHNKLYKCCTSLLGKLVQCQNVYVVRNEESKTTTEAYTQQLNVKPQIEGQLQKLLPTNPDANFATKASGTKFLFLSISFYVYYFFV